MALCLKVVDKSWETLWVMPGPWVDSPKCSQYLSVWFSFLSWRPGAWRLEFSLHESHLLQAAILGYPATWLQSFVATMILAMDNFFVTLQVRISKIRAGRKTPGLAAQHLESFKLAFASVPGKLLASLPNGSARIAGCGEYGHRTSGVCAMPRCVTWPLRLWKETRRILGQGKLNPVGCVWKWCTPKPNG